MTSSKGLAVPQAPSQAVELPLDELLERVGGDRRLLATLVEIQKLESPRALREIRQVLLGGDAVRLERAAHRLAGSLVVFGAAEATDAARLLERLGREGRIGDARQHLPTLELEVQRVLAALERLLPEPPA